MASCALVCLTRVTRHANRLIEHVRLGRYRLSVGLRSCLWALGSLRPMPWNTHEAAAEEIKTRAAKHLALQHFEAIHMPRDRPMTPRQRDAGFHRLLVLIPPRGKAL
jgi:hypothetical protein